MAYQASHKYARISARKVRPVANLVRGLNVNRALEVLEFLPQRGAYLFKMVVKSALANASQAQGINPNQLVVDQIYVNDGPLLHRPMGRFVARGRWHPIRKRTSHLHVVLDEGKKATATADAEGGEA
jgi:large subunit ribosomal protein L22